MAEHTSKSGGMIALSLAVAVGNAVSHLCTSAMPLQIGALVDGYALTATTAGTVGFFQVGALALSMILFAPLAHRYRPVRVCVLGFAVAILSNTLLYFSPAMPLLLFALAAIGGCGYGLILSAAVAAAASAPQPDKIYAVANSGSLLIVSALLLVLPFSSTWFGERGVFLGISLLAIVAIPLLRGFRPAGGYTRAAVSQGGRMAEGLPLLATWVLFSFGTGAMWTFAERIGHALQLPARTIGAILSGGVFIGLLGTGLAAVAASRFDRVLALAAGLIAGGAACMLMATAPGPLLYAAAVALYWIATMYVYVLLLGTAAAMDASGRLGTLGTGCERLAFAVSAPAAGLLVDFASFFWVGVIATVACVIAVPLCLPRLGQSLRRMARDPASAGDIA